MNLAGWDNWLGVPLNESWRAWELDYIPTNTSLGTTFDKALYRGYTDSSFTNMTEQPDWLGYQGPILRAEVNDMIEVCLFRPILYANISNQNAFGRLCSSTRCLSSGPICTPWVSSTPRSPRAACTGMRLITSRRVIEFLPEAVLCTNGMSDILF
jgi:hypothetical protein